MKAKPKQRSDNKGRQQTIAEAKRTNAEDLKSLTFQMPLGLHSRFKAVSAAKDKRMKDVLVGLVERYVKENE